MNFKKYFLLLTFSLLVVVSQVFAGDFYWVGNSGNWNDASHWSSTSGGKGGLGTPSSSDNVFIDNNSFSQAKAEVNIGSGISINNLNISSKKDFTINSPKNTDINIYGSVQVVSVFNNQIKSSIRFKSSKSENINLGWFLWQTDIYFEGTGTYKLSSPIQNHANSLNHVSGTLDLNGFDVLCGSFVSNSSQKRTLLSDKSTILAYINWKVEDKKNSYDFSKTTIYFMGEHLQTFNAEKRNYEIIGLNSGGLSTQKTVSNGVVSTDTVSCGNNCDGSLTVTANTTCPNATIDWLPGAGINSYTGECFNCPVPGPIVTNTITGLCPGVYTAVVRNDCDASVIAPQGRVEGHPSIVPIFEDVVQTKCKDTCDGAISIIVTGASFANFTYQWLPMPPFTLVDNTPSVSGLCTGNYSVEVRDGFGCIDTFDYFVPEPDFVYPNVTVTNISCFDDCSGTATANPTGGNGGYVYQWSANAAPNVLTNPGITNLCIGNYTVNILDSRGCPGDTTVTISAPDSLTITSSQINVSCGGYCDASATATVVTGGVGPYTHNWNTGFSETLNAGQVSSISGLCAGTYTDSISDGNGCDTVLTFIITEPDTLLTSTSVTNVTCFGANDGTAITTPINGTAPYDFSWSCGASTLDTIFGLAPGQCIVTVTDDNGCEIRDTITITEPDVLIANPAVVQDMSCPGVCDGIATTNPTGGTLPYSYSWDNTDLTQTTTTGLCEGFVVVTVTDSNLCVAIDSVEIQEPLPMILTMNQTDVTCQGACDGTGSVVVSGGTPNYSYNWLPAPTNGQGTDTIFGLCPNVYTVTVTDAGGCSASNSITIDEPNALAVNVTNTDLRCNQLCEGTATATPSGGTSPYSVSWDGAAFVPVVGASNTITNLCAGNHTLDVRDANGCIIPSNFTIDEPTPITTVSSGTDLSCFGVCSGSVTTTPSGGTSPYDFSWNTIPAPTLTQTVNNLCAGTYIVTITDDSLCTLTDTVTIIEPIQLNPNVQFTNISCNNLNNGTATALPTGGTAGYTIVWRNIPANTIIPGNPISGLSAGQYYVTVTDAAGCVERDTITITNPPIIVVNPSAISTSCETNCDGSATVNPTGGTGSISSFTFAWCSGDVTQTTASTLCPGTYCITVTDSLGCSRTDSVTIAPSIVITILTDTVGISCNGACDGEATANPVGGVLPYIYSWNTVPTQSSQTATGLCPGNYTVTVTDQTGCIATQSVTMPVDPSVLVPNGIATNVTCNGANDGTISANPTGGVPPYILTYSNTPQTGLAPGTYWVTVTDANLCSQTDTLVITEPDSIVSNEVIVDVNCNGNTTGSITLNPSGGTPGYTYLWGGGLGTNSSISSLGNGTYTVTITDTTGCTKLDTFDIVEPTVFSSNPLNVPETCFGDCDGIAGIIVSGGTEPHSTTWSNALTTDTITGLCPGTYSAIAIDANGCSTTQNVTILGPAVFNANVTGTSIECNGACTGTATAAPSGGNGGYTFVWTSVGGSPITNPTSSSISNLCPDTYNVTITDANGCTILGSYTVSDVAVLQVTLDSTNITCNGLNNGTATVTPIGGTAPYAISWVGGNLPVPTSTASISNLVPGVYTVNVTDTNGCFFDGTVIIEEPTLIIPNETVVDAACGANDGSISLNPSGGTPIYTHSWSNGSTLDNITNLPVGFYSDTITDANGCSQTFTFAISNPSGPSGVVTTVIDATCFGACNGSANVIPIGGTPGYTYNWNVPGQTDSTITGQCSGTYNLTITDAANCVLNTFVIIGEADSITANSSFTPVSCSGTCDGTASVTPSGGTSPYTYLWANGQTTSSVSNLCVGPTSVTITDFNGCTNVVNFDITSPNVLTVITSSTDVSCNGGNDGTVSVTPTDGTAPYTYQWDDALSQTTQTATGLIAGTYTVTVTDLNGCSTSDVVVVNENSLIVANEITTDATCGSNDGTAVVNPTGGAGGYTYFWPALGVSVPNVTGLSAGTYTVEITDANGCMQSFLIPINNANGPVVDVSTTDASCNGTCDGTASVAITSGTPNYTYLWTGTGITGQTTTSVSGLCADNYTIEVTDGNGCITVIPVIIGENSLITATVNTNDVTCNGGNDGSATVVPSGGVPPYSYSWSGPCAAPNNNAVAGLCAGNYIVTVTDALGCSSPINVVINENNVLSVTASANSLTCFGQNDGSATATPTGGTAPYTYLWSNSLTTPTIVGLGTGNYSVTVTDANGCSATDNVTIFSGNALTASFTTSDAACGVCDGSATINVGVGSGPYTYLWLPTGQTTPAVNNLCPGAYDVEVTNIFGCTQTFTVLISNPNGPDLLSSSDSTSCFESCDGAAQTEIVSGTSPFIYQWDDNLLQTNDTATALCAGLYNVVVQDSLGCISVDSVRVFEPEEILANLTSTPISCSGVCDATATVNPTGGVGAYTISWSNGDVGLTATNLCVGNHTVTITDDNGCSIVHNFTINTPTVLNLSLSSTSTTCNSDCDATALGIVNGGTPPYNYSWDTAPTQTNSLATTLCAGLYTLTVTDSRGCIISDTISVLSPNVLSTSSVVTDANCNGQNDGSITTNPTGGVAPYTYIWSTTPIQTGQTATGLAAGTYNVIVVDANGCTAYDTLVVNEPSTLNDSTTVNGPNCGVCDGSATANPVGGVGPFTYLWGNGDNTQTTTTGLCAGIITLQITDQGTGCIYDYNVIVNSVTGPDLLITKTDETCVGSCDGTALVSASNGNLPYSYSWSPVGGIDSLATGLCADFYTVTVTDALNCITIDTITINNSGLDLSIINVIPESCFNACDGGATVVVGAGTSPFIYQWNPTGGNNDVATNLCAGNYIAVVTDSMNCRDSISTVIISPDVLDVSINIQTQIACNAECDGRLIASPIGGTAPYTYLWSNGQSTQVISGLCAGTYWVEITDAGGCTATDTIILSEPTAILANENFIDPACNVCDGQIQLNPSGGTGPYQFAWGFPLVPQNTATVINLCAGVYSVDITDDNGCTNNFSFALSNTNAPDPNTTIINPTCNNSCDGSIVSNATGGTAPYSYVWSPNAAPNNLFDSTVVNLCSDIYTLNVTDAVGCVGVVIDTLVNPDVLLANVTSSNSTCNGFNDGWAVVHPIGGSAPYNTAVWTPGGVNDSISGLAPGTYLVSVTDANGCSVQDSAVITEPTLISASALVTDASCSSVCDGQAALTVNGGTGGYTFNWNPTGQVNSTATNLCFGSYQVTITDNSGCSILQTVNVGSLDTILAFAGNDTSVCATNSVTLNGTTIGLVTGVEWFVLPGMVSLGTNNSVVVSSAVAGTVCYVFEAYGVCNGFDTVCVTYNPQPVANAGDDITILEGTSTQLNASGGGTYVWAPAEGLSDTTISSPIANPLVTTTYTVTVTSAEGCTSTDEVVVTVIPTIRFPDGITPNGDGKNDTWVIDYIDQYPNHVVEIYNRWGELLYRSTAYKNDWDGTYNGENLPVGTYYYVIELNDGKTKPFTGPLTVLR